MNSVERVLTALRREKPDKVPYMYGFIDQKIREQILGEKITYSHYPKKADWSPVFGVGEPCLLEPYECTDARVARILGLDALGFQMLTPIIADVDTSPDGTVYIKKSLLNTPEALEQLKLPDVDDDRIYEPCRAFVNRHKGEFALFCRIRLGISPTLMSMGTEEFSYAIYDEPDFVKEIIKTYTDWVGRHVKNLIECGFDFIWSFDDMAFHSGPLFSNDVFNEFFFPYLKEAADKITVPWVFHSDGNLLPVLPHLVKLGMSGLHPLEPGTMDLEVLKARYGRQLCLIGNVDINYTLTQATLPEVDAMVKSKMDILGPDGGFIISDSNSVPAYCKVENVIQMAKSVEKYRYIY